MGEGEQSVEQKGYLSLFSSSSFCSKLPILIASTLGFFFLFLSLIRSRDTRLIKATVAAVNPYSNIANTHDTKMRAISIATQSRRNSFIR